MPKILLTPSFIKNDLTTPQGKRRIEYCDATFPGLYVEVRATSPGKGTYYLRYKDCNGKTCHQKLGRTYELTLTEARKRAKTLKAEITLGADPRAAAKVKKDVPTFGAFAYDEYLPYVKTRKRSYRNDESMLRLRLIPAFGDRPLNRLPRQQIQKLHTALRDDGLAPATCDHHVKLIRRMLNLAVEWGHLNTNPADKIPLFREDNTMERYMSQEEQDRLIEAIDSHSSRVIALMLLFLLSTGARRNEAMTATWENIDVEHRTWRIPATNSKSKKVRSVPLNDSALRVLSELATDKRSPYVFTNPRTKTRYNNINTTWDQMRKNAGLPELRIHDLRHQYASQLVNSGRSLYEVQQILGHSDPTVTQRYAHLSTTALQEAAKSASLTHRPCPTPAT